MILDPDSNSFYLMDSFCIQIPEASQGSDSVSKNIQFVSQNAESTNELISVLTSSSGMIKSESDKLAKTLSSFTQDLYRMTG